MVVKIMYIQCRFCGKQSAQATRLQRGVIFGSTYFQFYKCNPCLSFFLIPDLSGSQLVELYSTNYSSDNPHFEKSENYSEKFHGFIEFLKARPHGSKASFLDFGSGINSIPISVAKECGYDVFGMEFDSAVRELASMNTGARIFSSNELEKYPGKFDVIFLGDVLEHLNHPFGELSTLATKLSPSGVIYIQGPLQSAPTLLHNLLKIFVLMTPYTISRFPPYHVNLFSIKGMQNLVLRTNLKVVKIEVKEVAWPAPTFGELRDNFGVRSLLLYLIKAVDKVLGRFMRNYGTRIVLICEKEI